MALKTLPLLLSLLVVSCVSPNTKGRAATPQRPTVSSDTKTTAYQTLELEAGTLIDAGDAFSAPMTLKYGIDEDEELFISLSPINFMELPGNDAEGFGDLSVGMRRRVWNNDQAAAAIQLQTKLPTGDENDGISNGEIDFFAAAIADYEVDLATTITFFYQFGVVGQPGLDDSGIQHTGTIAGSHALNEDFGLFAEIAAIADPGIVDPMFGTFGITHPLSEAFIVDAGVRIGLNTDAPDAQFIVGMTTNFGNLFQ